MRIAEHPIRFVVPPLRHRELLSSSPRPLLRFGDAPEVLDAAASRQTLITLSLDDVLPTDDVIRLLNTTPNLDLLTRVKPETDPQAFYGRTPANRVEGTSANTTVGLLYLAAIFDKNSKVLDALGDYVRLHPERAARAVGAIGFDNYNAPAPAAYIDMLTALLNAVGGKHLFIRRNVLCGLGENPNFQYLPGIATERIRVITEGLDHMSQASLLKGLGQNPNPHLLPPALIQWMFHKATPRTLYDEFGITIHDRIKTATAIGLGASPNPQLLPPQWIQLLTRLARNHSSRQVPYHVAQELSANPHIGEYPEAVLQQLTPLIQSSAHVRELFIRNFSKNPGRQGLDAQYLPADLRYLVN